MILQPGETYAAGTISGDKAVIVVKGVVSWSTDGGTTRDKIYGPEHSPDNIRGRIIVSDGLTLDLYNDRNKPCEVLVADI